MERPTDDSSQTNQRGFVTWDGRLSKKVCFVGWGTNEAGTNNAIVPLSKKENCPISC